MSARWTPPEGEEVEPVGRADWRRWLAENHATARRVWLVSPKRSTGRQVVSYEDAIEEALCFGWVDSTSRRIDDERGALLFAPRRPGSTWARTNKERVARLTAAGLMADAGLRVVEAARADGSWNQLDDVEALRTPPDLAEALAADPVAAERFAALPPSARKQALWWVVSAKRRETRARRVAATVALAREGRVVR